MENTVKSYFDWKKDSKQKSVEKLWEKHEIISKWEKTDILYSFIGIYQIGIYVFHPDRCLKTDYTIKREDGKYFSLEYLSEEERFKEYKELNRAIEESKFIQHYDSLGNIIPIWPGGNADRGRAYCFDIPDIYFKKHEKWFSEMKQLYPDACLDGIIDSEFSTDDTKAFLDKMNEDTYCKFLKHVVDIIKKREKS